jgi:ribosomal protein S18 acetylase RimI-like enzyme
MVFNRTTSRYNVALSPLAICAMPINHPDLHVRPEVPQDMDFLAQLYRSTRGDLLQLSLPEVMIDNLISMQFNAQRTAYRTQFPDGEFLIVEKNGEPIGYLVTHHGNETIRLVCIAFLPDERNRGYGRSLIQTLQNNAAGAAKTLALTVDPRNEQAKHLYLSLGFQVNSDDGANINMSWP